MNHVLQWNYAKPQIGYDKALRSTARKKDKRGRLFIQRSIGGGGGGKSRCFLCDPLVVGGGFFRSFFSPRELGAQMVSASISPLLLEPLRLCLSMRREKKKNSNLGG